MIRSCSHVAINKLCLVDEMIDEDLRADTPMQLEPPISGVANAYNEYGAISTRRKLIRAFFLDYVV